MCSERDFPARAEAFVDEIAQQQPALIGLQEVAQFIAGNVYYPNQTVLPGTATTIDYLDILLNKLDERGLSYSTVVSTNGFGGVFTGLVDVDVDVDVRNLDCRTSSTSIVTSFWRAPICRRPPCCCPTPRAGILRPVCKFHSQAR